jgi:hypothetical protein
VLAIAQCISGATLLCCKRRLEENQVLLPCMLLWLSDITCMTCLPFWDVYTLGYCCSQEVCCGGVPISAVGFNKAQKSIQGSLFMCMFWTYMSKYSARMPCTLLIISYTQLVVCTTHVMHALILNVSVCKVDLPRC